VRTLLFEQEVDDLREERCGRGATRCSDVQDDQVGACLPQGPRDEPLVVLVDKFPPGAVMNKGLTIRSAQQHGQRYIPMLLERMARDEIVTEHLATHVMPLDDGPDGYAMFKEKTDGCVRAVFRP